MRSYNFMKKKKINKALGLAVCLGLMCGITSTSFAATYNQGIVGDPSYEGVFDQFVNNDNGLVYNFGDEAVAFNLTDNEVENFEFSNCVIAGYPNSKFTINAPGGLKIDTNVRHKKIAAIQLSDGADITINGNVDIKAKTKIYGVSGISIARAGSGMGKKTTLTINGDVKMREDNAEIPWAITEGGRAYKDYVGCRWEATGIYLGSIGGSTININGMVDLAVKGAGVVVDPFYNPDATINIKGGMIEVPQDMTHGYYSLASYGGTINMNMITADGELKPGDSDVRIIGNTFVIKEAGASGRPFFYSDGTINLALTTSDSKWFGVIDNSNKFASGNKDTSGDFNLYLQNNAKWVHKAMSKTNALEVATMPVPSNENHYGEYDGISHVTSLTGGNSAETTGIVFQRDAANIAIDSFGGHVIFDYEHKGDGSNTGDYVAGDVKIKQAREGSVVTLSTDSAGIDVADEDAARSALTALATKLSYENFTQGERTLLAKVQIAEGLTTPSVSVLSDQVRSKAKDGSDVKSNAYINFDENTGTGSYSEKQPYDVIGGAIIEPDKPIIGPVDPKLIYGNTQTAMMRGAKAAMVSSAMMWRSENTDMLERIGDFAKSANKDGIWARMYGGEMSYDAKLTDYNTSFKGIQVGHQKAKGNGWTVGQAFSYMEGNSSYEFAGDGKNKSYSLAAYGTWKGNDGKYLDLVAKGSKVSNKYTVLNASGNKLSGEYENSGVSIGAEYGKRVDLGDGMYVTPKVQLTYGSLSSDDYLAHSDWNKGTDLRVQHNTFNSLIGSVGVGFGESSEKSNYYGSVAYSQEFCADLDATFNVPKDAGKTISQDFSEGWVSVRLGGERKLGKDKTLYADFEKTFGGDLQTKWKANAGLRWNF